MKLFITGISGLLGLNFALQASKEFEVSGAYLNHPVYLAGVEPLLLDLTSFASTEEVLHGIQPDIIVNTAALTDVDGCEENPDTAYQLNVDIARNVATVANDLGSRLVHISTDQLFDGTKSWCTEEDTPAPINTYGRTKWLAEGEVIGACPQALIIRTNFFGWGTSRKSSFSDWILRGLEQQRPLGMFTDVFFTPILMNHLVDMAISMATSEAHGIFHVTGSERISKHDFALKLVEAFGYSTELIQPTSVEQFPFKAPRPKEMTLNCEKAENSLKLPMPTVDAGLEKLRSLQREGWHQTLAEATLPVTSA